RRIRWMHCSYYRRERSRRGAALGKRVRKNGKRVMLQKSIHHGFRASSARTRRSRLLPAIAPEVQMLESRTLLSAALSNAVPAILPSQGQADNTQNTSNVVY